MPMRFQASQLHNAAAEIVSRLNDSRSVVSFTGAGISTESGIPDFRSPGGVWSKNRTVYFDEYCRNPEARYEYWRQKSEAHQGFVNAAPNITHRTLAKWESAGILRGVITQNIDGLHQAAGSQCVLELHGTARQVACLSCSWRDSSDLWVEMFLTEDRVPICPDCGGPIKHATISFGQSLPADVLNQSAEWATDADLFFVLGSSLVVEPAASLPRIAKKSGAGLVIINRDTTPLDDIADVVLNAPLGEIFNAVLGHLG